MMKRVEEIIQSVSGSLKTMFYLLICVGFTQCIRVPTVKISVSDINPLEEISVTHSEELGSVLSMHSLDDKYMVSFYRDTLCLGVLDSSMNLISRFGRKGRGPMELLAPRLTGQYLCDDEGYKVLVFERFMNQMLTYSLGKDGNVRNVVADSLPRHYGDMRIAYNLQDYYWGIIDNQNQDVFMFDKNTGGMSLYDVPDRRQRRDYQSIVTAHPDKAAFALAYYSLPRIDIIGADGKCQQIIQIDELAGATLGNDSADCFLDICSSEKYIYALLDNNERNDLLLCLDWEGNYRTAFSICNTSTLCLNEDKLLCLDYDDNGLVITEYALI